MNKTGILAAFLLIVMVFSIPAMAEEVISNISTNQSTEQTSETNKEENNDEEIKSLEPSDDKDGDKNSMKLLKLVILRRMKEFQIQIYI